MATSVAETSIPPRAEVEPCNGTTEFHCRANNRCIPMEWRCDFTEQCLDGQDEFGCAQEWCDFSQSMCNLENDQTQTVGGSDIWRRYSLRHLNRSQCEGADSGAHSPGGHPGGLNGLECNGNILGEKILLLPIEMNSEPSVRESEKWSKSLGPKVGKLTNRVGQLKFPPLGQTNSMCKLNFKYFMSAGQTKGHGSGRVELTFKVMIRQLRSPSAEFKVVWSKTVDSLGRLVPFRAQSEPSAASQQPANEWLVGMVELGHLKQIELAFRVESSLIETDDDSLDFSKSKDNNNNNNNQLAGLAGKKSAKIGDISRELTSLHEHGRGPLAWPQWEQEFSFESGSFVALDWLKFQGCAWPDRWGHKGSRSLSDKSSAGGCRASQFQCSNNICLEEEHLCNFVDDCMVSDGRLSEAEDESVHLCELVPGRENFEPVSEDERDLGSARASVPLEATSKNLLEQHLFGTAKFWRASRVGWRSDKISIQRGHSLEATTDRHLPQRDHTTRNQDGHYLSLEVPSGAEQSVLWFYLDSPRLKRLDGAGKGGCRVKFFYNIVTEGEVAPAQKLPFKLYLTLEHFVINDGKTSKSLKRNLNAFLSSHKSQYEDLVASELSSSIEHMGIDFWRELNVKLSDLKVGDEFYIRIAFIVELNPSSTNLHHRTTINIDDLSTHFGCFQNQSDYHSADWIRSAYLNQSFDQGLFLRRPAQIGPEQLGRPARRARIADSAVDFEPHHLILYVFIVLFAGVGSMLIIVFVLVPFAGQIIMDYHDRLAEGLSDVATKISRDSTVSAEDTYELTEVSNSQGQVANVCTLGEGGRCSQFGSGSNVTDSFFPLKPLPPPPLSDDE